MLRQSKYLFLILSFWPLLSQGDVGFYAKVYQQMKHHQFCGDILNPRMNPQGLTCQKGTPYRGYTLLEKTVFDYAAEKQIQKNNCIQEQLSALENDPQVLQEWLSALLTAWLGVKQSELILQFCHDNGVSAIDLAGIQDRRQAYEAIEKQEKLKTSKADDSGIFQICKNKSQLDRLQQASTVLRFSLPVINDPEFLQWMEKNRHVVINKKTGKPLTDAELFELNLKNTSLLELRPSPELIQQFTDQFASFRNQRDVVTQEIERYRRTPSSSLSQSVKDFIYEDGTLIQAMKGMGIVDSEHQSLNNSSSNSQAPLSQSAICLLSQYEQTLGGVVAQLVGEVSTLGFAAIKAPRLLGLASETLSNVQTLKKAIGLGLTYSMLLHAAPDLMTACFDSVNKSKPFVARPQQDVNLLSGRIDVGNFDIEIDPRKIPSCKQLENTDFATKDAPGMSCASNSAFLITMALPAVARTPAFINWLRNRK